MTYALTVTVDLPFDAAVEATREALAGSGFGVVADIDLQATFDAKLGATAASELGGYRILGACNPRLAQRAVTSEPEVGLLLPCNVVVRRGPDATSTTVQAIDPSVISDLSGGPAVAEVAAEATALLKAALDLLSAGGVDRSGTDVPAAHGGG
ncbi:MAG TPA: DUF302 domain-containing protein [Ornithinibacter sp.]|nr:DUF302 domain-containing protein [Ornithinibacter sp.]